jgi:hypothetical protein
VTNVADCLLATASTPCLSAILAFHAVQQCFQTTQMKVLLHNIPWLDDVFKGISALRIILEISPTHWLTGLRTTRQGQSNIVAE